MTQTLQAPDRDRAPARREPRRLSFGLLKELCRPEHAFRDLSPNWQFLRTETGSAAVLLCATAAALAWANLSASSYQAVWATRLSVSLGSATLSQDLGRWVDSGLMTLFFLVVGLEARREFDMGELRQRRRLALPALAGVGGMLLPVGIYLAVNAGQPSGHGWGVSMSTDTAFALGALALVGRRLPDRVRTYLLTFSVVDDLAGIAVIAFAYSGTFRVAPLLAGAAILVVVAVMRFRGLRSGAVYLLLGVAAWVAFFKSGVDPVVVGLVLGLLSYARPGRAQRPRAGHGRVPAVPGAAHARTGAVGPGRGTGRALPQ